jgi:Flp pilus assembly protein CpaB
VTYRLRNIVLAIALATLAAALTSFYVSNYKKSVRDGEENVTVFVASRDIPAGTSGAKAAALLTPTQVERQNMVTGAITSRDQVKDLIVTDKVFKDEQAIVRRFKPVEQAGIKAELKANVRAVQLSGDANQLLAGTLKKGDRIDVLGNFKVREGNSNDERHYARTVLRDVLVLRAPQGDFSQGKLEGAVGSTGSVQLALTDAQASKLFFTIKNGDWHLDLRSVNEATDSPESLESIDTILCDGMPRTNRVCSGRTR